MTANLSPRPWATTSSRKGILRDPFRRWFNSPLLGSFLSRPVPVSLILHQFLVIAQSQRSLLDHILQDAEDALLQATQERIRSASERPLVEDDLTYALRLIFEVIDEKGTLKELLDELHPVHQAVLREDIELLWDAVSPYVKGAATDDVASCDASKLGCPKPA